MVGLVIEVSRQASQDCTLLEPSYDALVGPGEAPSNLFKPSEWPAYPHTAPSCLDGRERTV